MQIDQAISPCFPSQMKTVRKMLFVKENKGNILELLKFVYMILAPFIPNTRSN